MNITIFGAGYVGLVAGACWADLGNDVLCVDTDAAKVAQLSKAMSLPAEPELQGIVERNLSARRLRFTSDLRAGVVASDLIFIAVGTPRLAGGGADISGIINVARAVGRYATSAKIVIQKSTAPVGTTREVLRVCSQELRERGVQLDIRVGCNPEFLKQGSAVKDFSRPQRIVVGVQSPDMLKVLRDVYEPFQRNRDRMMVMDIESAELTKYASNAMLAARISFMNEIARICEHVGADVDLVRRGMGADPRIGGDYLYAGLGYGGSCLPKDISALQWVASRFGEATPQLAAIEQVNTTQLNRFLDKIKSHFNGLLTGKKIAVWGFAFKGGTDDLRDSPGKMLIDALIAQGAILNAYDPLASIRINDESTPQLIASSNAYDALDGCEALVITTDATEFKSPNFEEIRQRLAEPVIFDGKNLYRLEKMCDEGITYISIGRPQLRRGQIALKEVCSEMLTMEHTRGNVRAA